MKTSSRKMPLKPYLEAVREHCRGLSKEELIAAVIEMAEKIPIGGRADFLDKIRGPASRPSHRHGKTGKDFTKSLLDRIAVLQEEIEERIRSIEDGDYWEEPDSWETDYYGEEEPGYLSAEQTEELENLFLETGSIFLDGQLKKACQLYRALFDLVDENGETHECLSRDSIDLREERARYCRCVYETADPKKRVQSVLESIGVEAPLNDFRLDLAYERFPMIQDVVDARPGELADWEIFLRAWEKTLSQCRGDRAAVLRIEAIQKLEGIDGVSRLAREWKSGQPRAYLFWIQCLENLGDWRSMVDVTQEALEALPKGGFREQAAEYMTTAAARLGNPELVLRGRRERFLSLPRETNLIALLGEATKQNVRSRELDTAIASLHADRKNKAQQGNLRIRMLLMAGRFREAFEEGQGEKSLGWSHGKGGLLFASILSILTRNSSEAVIIKSLLERYCGTPGYWDEDYDGAKSSDVYKEIVTGLKSVQTDEPEALKYWAWANRIGRARIEAIVSGQFRDAYEAAARVLGALAECCVLANKKEEARSLLHEFIVVKFPRHSAFRREAKLVASGSNLIRELRAL
jgi:hypothetical protein